MGRGTRNGIAACAVAGALAVAGTASAGLSAAQWLKKGNAVCAADSAKANAVPAPKSGKDYVPYFKQEIKIGFQLLDDLDAIGTLPASIKGAVLAAARAHGVVIGALTQLDKELTTSKDPAKTFAAVKPLLGKLVATENADWRKAGLPACA